MSHSQTHHEKWLHACERLAEAEKLVVSAQGRSRTVLLETIERWGKVRDWHAWEIIHTSARESLDAWEAIVGPIENEPERRTPSTTAPDRELVQGAFGGA